MGPDEAHNANGGWFVLGGPAEVVPRADLRPHVSGMVCWCKPMDDEGVIVHNALDGRERLERKEQAVQ